MAAVQLHAHRARRSTTSASAATTCPSARTARTTTDNHVPRVGKRAARPAVLQRIAAAGALGRHRVAVARRGADRPRARRVHERRRAAGGRRDVLEFEAASDLDYVRGAHSFRTGILLEGGRYRIERRRRTTSARTRSRAWRDTTPGVPASYTRRVGDPADSVHQRPGRRVRAGRLPAREEPDAVATACGTRRRRCSPISSTSRRASTMTWSPLKSGKTTFRAGYGLFTDWLGTGIYEQTQRSTASVSRK